MIAGEATFEVSSDAALKEDFFDVDTTGVVNALLNLPSPKQYKFKFGTFWSKAYSDSLKTKIDKDAYAARALKDSQKIRVGFMAQDAYKVSVALNPATTDSSMYRESDIVKALVLTVQAQQRQINDLLARVVKLEGN